MPRFEFSKKQRLEIWTRANGHCEECNAKLKTGEGEYDHIIAQGYGGENETENGQLICSVCHKSKTKKDVGLIAKAKRNHAKQNGYSKPKPRPLPGTKASGIRKKFNGSVERR